MTKLERLYDEIFAELIKLTEEQERPPPKQKSVRRDAKSTTKKTFAPRRKRSLASGSDNHTITTTR